MKNSKNLISSRLSKRGQSKLEVRLNQSLRYRSSHKQPEIPDETSEKYFHPERQGLFCDAPMGLKY
jgi:hypothetical protein